MDAVRSAFWCCLCCCYFLFHVSCSFYLFPPNFFFWASFAPGQTVGVISDSISCLSSFGAGLAANEIPAVTIIQELTPCTGATDEGLCHATRGFDDVSRFVNVCVDIRSRYGGDRSRRRSGCENHVLQRRQRHGCVRQLHHRVAASWRHRDRR